MERSRHIYHIVFMTMKHAIFTYFVCLFAYVERATTDGATDWLQNDFPDRLSFHVKHGQHGLTLNLQKHSLLDPNTDIHTVRKLNDGMSSLEKANLEKEKGNIRIGNSDYELHETEDVTSSDILQEKNVAKRYVLRDRFNSERKVSVERRDETSIQEKNVEGKLRDIEESASSVEDKNNHYFRSDGMISNQQRSDPYIKGAVRNPKTEYHVKVLVLGDSSIYDLFMTTVDPGLDITKREPKALKNARRYLSHIMNSVRQLYIGIEDPDMQINVYMNGFLVFGWMATFRHVHSSVKHLNGTKMIDGNHYITDLANWDLNPPMTLPDHDLIILFTRYRMYRGNDTDTHIGGLSIGPNVCSPGYGVQIVYISDYFRTVSTTAHELGHNLGADHDGEGNAKAGKAEDQFIMSSGLPVFDMKKNYSRNPWLFSTSSVNSFKETLKSKQCVTVKPSTPFNDQAEFKKFMLKLPGKKYSPSKQCHLINGRGSIYCGSELEHICQFMLCTDPKTSKCMDTFFSAATGTKCGTNKVV